MNIAKIQTLDLKHKRVFLRADLNTPLKNKKILQDFKLHSILPTIDHILKNGGKVILATHIGQPDAKSQTNFFDENLSTKILQPWFEKNGYKIKYEIDLKKAELESKQNFSEILLLENLRFFNGEKEHNLEFAQMLATLGDIYVNDAFGACHRNNTSMTLVPELFNKKNKAFGLLIQKEIENLNKLKNNIQQPFTIVLGGNKIKDKIKLLENFITQNKVKSILLGGAVTNSLLNKKETDLVQSNVKIFLPQDFIKVDNKNVDIGYKTIKTFEEEIGKAKTIFANGPMGIYEKKESKTGTQKILNKIANSNAFTVIGGGDIVAATFLFNLEKKINFLSTGGGATLFFLSCKNPLEQMPGLRSIIKS